MIGSRSKEPQTFIGHLDVSGCDRSELTGLPEREVIRRAQLGDASAFERIYRLYSRRVYALCLRMLGNWTEAEDLTQEAFLGVFRKIQSFRGESAFSTWLHRVAVNLVLMRLRKKASQETSLEKSSKRNFDCGGPQEELGGHDLQLAGTIDRINLQHAMDQLGRSQRLVVELHDIQGYKHKEIAQIMDWSIGNSKAQLHRARRRLRELLHETLRLDWVTHTQISYARLNER
jgi:RNA polymerase sigma-70 factor (ECF subfamily)